MPHATASWLVDNTSLTFQQIAEFCGLHILEVQAIADDTAATKLTGRDPLRSGELTMDEIEKGQDDPAYHLKMHREPDKAVRTKGPRYTPVSKRQDKPDGVAWLIRNHPELSDGQIGKLIGTTRSTIQAIRERSHWNIANIQPKDPVTLGLTSQRELDAAVAKAAKAGRHRSGSRRRSHRARPRGADRGAARRAPGGGARGRGCPCGRVRARGCRQRFRRGLCRPLPQLVQARPSRARPRGPSRARSTGTRPTRRSPRFPIRIAA
jgi:hypothetical protein